MNLASVRVGFLRGLWSIAWLGGMGLVVPAAAAEPPAALTVILVRHGEKESVPPGTPVEKQDPGLTPAGRERALELARMLGDAGITAIYATHFQRTQQTVRPLAERLGLTPTVLDAGANAELARQIRAHGDGAVILVAGHDASLPEVIAALGGPRIPTLPATAFDRFLVLTVRRDGPATLLQLRYGPATAP